MAFFIDVFIPPERSNVFIREASFSFINNEQFVLELFRLHWETFEENVCEKNGRKNKLFLSPSHTHTQTRTHSFINSYLNMHIKHTHTESLPTDKMEIFLPMMKNLQMHLEGKKAPSIITSAYKFYRSTCKLIYITTNLN